MSRALPDGTRIAQVTLRSRDLSRLLPFYRELLGLVVIEETESRVALSLSRASAPILFLVEEGKAGASGIDSAGGIPFRVQVPVKEVLYCLRNRAPLLGYRAEEISGRLYITDPESNVVEIESCIEEDVE